MNIELYHNIRGDCFVDKYIKGLNPREQRYIFKSLEDKLSNRSLNDLLKAEIVKKIKVVESNNLYEFIPGRHRIFFSIYQVFYLLWHAFPKKSNKTPQKEIERALSYKKDYENRYNIK